MVALELLLRLLAFASLFVGGYFIGRRAGWKEAIHTTHRNAFAALRRECDTPAVCARSGAYNVVRSVVRRTFP